MNLLLIYIIPFLSLFSQNNQSNKIDGTWTLLEYVGFKNEPNYPERLKVDNPSSIIISFTPRDTLYLLCGMKNQQGFSGYSIIKNNRILKLNIAFIQTITVDAEKVIFKKNIGQVDSYKIKGDYLYLYFDDEDKYFKLKRTNSDNRNEFFATCESKDIYKIKLGPK